MTETVELANVHSTPKRIVLGAIGLAVAVFPIWDLWPGMATLSLISPIFWIIGLGALAIGVALVSASIFGASTLLSIGPDGITLLRESPVGRQTQRLTTEDLGPIRVEEQDWTDGPSSWRVSIELRGSKPLVSESLGEAAKANELAARIGHALDRAVVQG